MDILQASMEDRCTPGGHTMKRPGRTLLHLVALCIASFSISGPAWSQAQRGIRIVNYIDFEMNIWFGVVAPAKTPKETLDQLAGWLTVAMAAQEVRSKLIVQGLYPDTRCGTPFGA